MSRASLQSKSVMMFPVQIVSYVAGPDHFGSADFGRDYPSCFCMGGLSLTHYPSPNSVKID